MRTYINYYYIAVCDDKQQVASVPGYNRCLHRISFFADRSGGKRIRKKMCFTVRLIIIILFGSV